MRAWITKNALTDGIKVVDDAQIIVDQALVSRSVPGLIPKGDWWPDEASARNAAERMRCAEILRLREILERLESLDFGATAQESGILTRGFKR